VHALALILNRLPFLPDWANSIILPLNRWLHMVSMAMLVGGTLFYEFVIPKAIEDLKDESQLAVLGRVRWIFRQVVLVAAVMLVLTGILWSFRNWPGYTGDYKPVFWWWLLHSILSLFAIAIAILVTIGDRVPQHPIAWLRVNFVVMLVALFAADLTVYIRQTIYDALQHNPPAPTVNLGSGPPQNDVEPTR
jgi:uncharacterized membrane protein